MEKQTLNLEELKALMQKAFNAGVSTGKKMIPFDRIPMGSKVQSAGNAFELFFEKLIEDIKRA